MWSNKKKFLVFLFALLVCALYINGQKRNSTEANQDREPQLTSLTEEERALDLHNIISNQPDFVADKSFFYGEGFGGFGASEHIARKGNKYRWDNGYLIVIGEPGKAAIRLYPQAKIYNDIETGVGDDLLGFEAKTLSNESDVTLTALGTLIIDGHKCIKIQATRKDHPEIIFLYSAEDLKYLIIASQFLNLPRGSVQKLSNISLNVPDSLFEIPSGYQGIEHRQWTKVENAKVSYGGKQSRDFGVFRSPTDELFIWVNDADYPWYYLVRLKEATAEVAFQGMLVTHNGEYVWQTSEKEAFSGPDEPPGHRLYTCKGSKCPKVIVTPNSVKFPSIGYEGNKALIEVSW
jgi:hypothetical protein